jgi:hypothetical protein
VSTLQQYRSHLRKKLFRLRREGDVGDGELRVAIVSRLCANCKSICYETGNAVIATVVNERICE